jgi:hypothetical protein
MWSNEILNKEKRKPKKGNKKLRKKIIFVNNKGDWSYK